MSPSHDFGSFRLFNIDKVCKVDDVRSFVATKITRFSLVQSRNS